jgi:tRNA-Thr(GGU) m(6)t(6)A37 methyltransferase TsaA
VFYWFHENDHPNGRSVLEVRPRKDPHNPLTGVFGTRSPLRPNLIALSLCKIIEVKGEAGEILVKSLDARDGSPLIDIKPYLPYSDRAEDLRLPEWAKNPP